MCEVQWRRPRRSFRVPWARIVANKGYREEKVPPRLALAPFGIVDPGQSISADAQLRQMSMHLYIVPCLATSMQASFAAHKVLHGRAQGPPWPRVLDPIVKKWVGEGVVPHNCAVKAARTDSEQYSVLSCNKTG